MKNLFYIVLSSIVFISCSRDTEKNNGLPEGVNIQIKVTGIEDENTFQVVESELENRITKASLPRPIVFNDSEDLESYQIESLAEFDVLTDVYRGIEHKVMSKIDCHHVFLLMGSDIEFMDELALYLESLFKTVFIMNTLERRDDLEMEIRSHLCNTPLPDLKLIYY